jgi:arsenite methyltransferase
MADIVGRDGAVIGIDISSELVALRKRRSPPKWLSYGVEDATQLAQPNASFDAVVCTQIAEYIPDVNRALFEAFRVVKRGGWALLVATDWDAVVWHSETPDSMAFALNADSVRDQLSSLVKTDQSDSNRSGKKRRKPQQWSRATGLVG